MIGIWIYHSIACILFSLFFFFCTKLLHCSFFALHLEQSWLRGSWYPTSSYFTGYISNIWVTSAHFIASSAQKHKTKMTLGLVHFSGKKTEFLSCSVTCLKYLKSHCITEVTIQLSKLISTLFTTPLGFLHQIKIVSTIASVLLFLISTVFHIHGLI